MKKFIAIVRVRKQDRNGNTYHDVNIYDLNQKLVASVTKEYGYSTQYEVTTERLLENYLGKSRIFKGLTDKHYQNGYRETRIRQAVQLNRIKIMYFVNRY